MWNLETCVSYFKKWNGVEKRMKYGMNQTGI
jgi:hypothetical protein